MLATNRTIDERELLLWKVEKDGYAEVSKVRQE
jgi:hypothetical protein